MRKCYFCHAGQNADAGLLEMGPTQKFHVGARLRLDNWDGIFCGMTKLTIKVALHSDIG